MMRSCAQCIYMIRDTSGYISRPSRLVLSQSVDRGFLVARDHMYTCTPLTLRALIYIYIYMYRALFIFMQALSRTGFCCAMVLCLVWMCCCCGAGCVCASRADMSSRYFVMHKFMLYTTNQCQTHTPSNSPWQQRRSRLKVRGSSL